MTSSPLERAARATLLLGALYESGPIHTHGSGVLLHVSPDRSRGLVATVAHVLDKIAEHGPHGRGIVLGSHDLTRQPEELCRYLARIAWARRHPSLDLALLGVEADQLPRVAATLELTVPSRGTEVSLLGYPAIDGPGGRPLRISSGWCIGLSGSSLDCQIAALEGDSGGPVVNREGGVVGMHFASTRIQWEGCNPLMTVVTHAIPAQALREFLPAAGKSCAAGRTPLAD